jgi:hypothetical protein
VTAPSEPTLDPAAALLLDWRAAKHWGTPRPCRLCGGSTATRDETGAACHRTCAETALAAELARSTAAYRPRQGGTTP